MRTSVVSGPEDVPRSSQAATGLLLEARRGEVESTEGNCSLFSTLTSVVVDELGRVAA
jgi:hypothetical protein